jgi:AraC-like DNA-binding protein
LTWTAPTPVGALGLVGHLVDHLIETPVSPHRGRVEQVLFDLLEPLPAVAVRLPRLDDDRARRVADALATNPADDRTLDEWGRFVGASGRTLARAIRADSGMGFAEWRTHVRIAHAAQRLAEGARVGRIARDVGYATPSAFVAAFRRVVGTSPGAYASAHAGRHRASPTEDVPVTTIPPHSVVDLVTTRV